MSTNLNEREDRLLSTLDWLIFLIATATLIAFVGLYFSLPNIQYLGNEAKIFWQSLLINLIPIPLLFIASYITFRRIQTIRDERNRDQFIDILAKNLSEELTIRETRKVLLENPPIERDRSLEWSKELLLVGVALNKTIHKNYSLLLNKLRQGNKIKVILVKPQSEFVNLVAKRKISNADTTAMRNYIELTLLTLCGMKKDFPSSLEVRVIDYPLSFGAVAADMNEQNGKIFVEYYFFKTDKEGLYIMLNPNDKPWYSYFREQIDELWETAEEWTCETPKIATESILTDQQESKS